ncbi:MAG: Abi family protein [Clostridia bacterium]|nr:Abi family protein [Clostridia bacterium]
MITLESPRGEKPKLTVAEQVQHLKRKGIKFDRCSEEDAALYLAENNNYFKLRAYRTSFEKYQNGVNEGLYINLDFAALRDLAIIDMELRYIILPMALDIEHFEKVKLLKYIASSNEDGYRIVSEYLNDLQQQDALESKNSYGLLMSEITRNSKNSYCSGIVQRYEGHFPVWAFLEVITFGSFIYFLRYCLDYFADPEFDKLFRDDFYLMLSIKAMRNAAAHNNCILNQLARGTAMRSTNFALSRAISNMGITKSQRDRLMSSAAVQDFVTLLYAHSQIVTSDGVKRHKAELLKKLTKRFTHHADYYASNPVITTSFDFLQKVVDKLFGMWYNTDT